MSFTFIDLFAGIGGFRIALDSLQGKCVAFSEIDKDAVSTYISNYGDNIENNLGDITKIQSIPTVDMLVGGVPCQSWSVAGKMKGFDDPRGQLWNDATRLVAKAKPKVFIFENVKGLIGAKNKKNFAAIITAFEEQGYLVQTGILNSYDFNVPQLRERVFIVGFRKDFNENFERFSFPEGIQAHKNLAEYLDNVEKRDISKKKLNPSVLFGSTIPASRNAFQKNDELNDFFTFCDTRNGHTTVHSWDLTDTTAKQKLIMETILKNRRKKIYGDKDGNPLSLGDICELMPTVIEDELNALVEMGLLRKVGEKFELKNSKNSSGIDGVYRVYMPYSKIFSTLTATGTKDVIATEYIDVNIPPAEYKRQFIEKIFLQKNYRQISVTEAQRIHGFPENFVSHSDEKAAKKQFGNAVSPPVIEALAIKILETGIFGGTYESCEETRNSKQSTIVDGTTYRCPAYQKHKKAI